MLSFKDALNELISVKLALFLFLFFIILEDWSIVDGKNHQVETRWSFEENNAARNVIFVSGERI